MFPEQYLLIWNPVPWTVSDPDLLDRFSDQTILFLDRAGLVITGLRDITQKVSFIE